MTSTAVKLTSVVLLLIAAFPQLARAHAGHPDFPTHESAHAVMALAFVAVAAVSVLAIVAIGRAVRKRARQADALAPSRRTT